jgi:hypothetical protein
VAQVRPGFPGGSQAATPDRPPPTHGNPGAKSANRPLRTKIEDENRHHLAPLSRAAKGASTLRRRDNDVRALCEAGVGLAISYVGDPKGFQLASRLLKRLCTAVQESDQARGEP